MPIYVIMIKVGKESMYLGKKKDFSKLTDNKLNARGFKRRSSAEKLLTKVYLKHPTCYISEQ